MNNNNLTLKSVSNSENKAVKTYICFRWLK